MVVFGIQLFMDVGEEIVEKSSLESMFFMPDSPDKLLEYNKRLEELRAMKIKDENLPPSKQEWIDKSIERLETEIKATKDAIKSDIEK